MSYFVDVHTHLTHEKFTSDQLEVIQRADDHGLKAVVVNGLDPESNRQILELAKQHSIIKPALGIYPIDAVFDLVGEDFPREVASFDRDAEIAFIEEQAKQGSIIAVGECGMDGYWLGEDTFAKQEEIWTQLLDIGLRHDIPVIIHSRKLEKRCFEILDAHGVKKVVMHCYGGKVKLAQKYAEKCGYYFSIPANCNVNESFQKMLERLPHEQILTETDAPYLGTVKGERNEPANVRFTVAMFAKVREWEPSQAKKQICDNYERLFLK